MHVGMWSIAAIVILLASWVMYKYMAPSGWKEWTNAGVLQAFIIALYAEMYGFPLTIYLLSRYLGLDASWTEGGNLWAQVFGTPLAHILAMVIGYIFVFSGVTLVADGWRAVYRARKEGYLVTSGTYAKIRHPQYTGLFMILFGEGIVHWPTIVSVAAFPIIVGAYTYLAKQEEKAMVHRFGQAYEEYRRRVPMFIPRWQPSPEGVVS